MTGVVLVFNGKVILGTRARKTRSKSFEAFSSINYPVLALVQDGRLIRYIRPECAPEPIFSDRVDDKVALLKLIPARTAAWWTTCWSGTTPSSSRASGWGACPPTRPGTSTRR